MLSARKTALYPLLAVNFVGTLGLGIVLPFLVYLVTDFGGNAVIYGIFGATYSAFQMIGAPLLGRWSDSFGRRRILLLSHLGTLVSWLIFFTAFFLPVHKFAVIDSPLLGSFSLTLPLLILFFARVLDGLTGGNVSVANAYLADITEETRRSENFGKMAVSSNLGYIFGPALAGLLGATLWAEKLPVLAAILISVITSFIIIYYLPESQPETLSENPEKMNVRKILAQEQKECFRIDCKATLTFHDVLKMRLVALLLLIYFFVFLGFNFFYIAFPIHAVEALNWELTQTGLFFSFLSMVMVLIQGPVLKRLSVRLSDPLLVCAGSLFLSSSFLYFISAHNFLIYTGAVFLAVGNGIMWPSLLALISRTVPEKFQGSIQGYSGSLGSAASIIGLLSGGLLYARIGSGIFVLSASVIFMIFIMSFSLLRIKNFYAAHTEA